MLRVPSPITSMPRMVRGLHHQRTAAQLHKQPQRSAPAGPASSPASPAAPRPPRTLEPGGGLRNLAVTNLTERVTTRDQLTTKRRGRHGMRRMRWQHKHRTANLHTSLCKHGCHSRRRRRLHAMLQGCSAANSKTKRPPGGGMSKQHTHTSARVTSSHPQRRRHTCAGVCCCHTCS